MARDRPRPGLPSNAPHHCQFATGLDNEAPHRNRTTSKLHDHIQRSNSGEANAPEVRLLARAATLMVSGAEAPRRAGSAAQLDSGLQLISLTLVTLSTSSCTR